MTVANGACALFGESILAYPMSPYIKYVITICNISNRSNADWQYFMVFFAETTLTSDDNSIACTVLSLFAQKYGKWHSLL